VKNATYFTESPANNNVTIPAGSSPTNAFYERDGYISIEAIHYSKAIASSLIKWQVIPNLGRTASAITTFPSTANSEVITVKSPRLEYSFYTTNTGVLNISTLLSPTLNFHNEGLRFAISVDEETPQVINMHEGFSNAIWESWVANNIIEKTSIHSIKTKGWHTLKLWRVDGGVVVQKIVAHFGTLKHSYLGPPETIIKKK
jgi:hypothetical protein